MNECVFMQPSFFESLQLFFYAAFPFGFSVMISPFSYFAPKLFCFACSRLLVCIRILCPYWLRDCFRCFETSCFVCIDWSSIFLGFLLFHVPSYSSLRVLAFLLIALLFFLLHNVLSCFSSALVFLLVVVDFLPIFPVQFAIQVLTFCSCSSGETRFFTD